MSLALVGATPDPIRPRGLIVRALHELDPALALAAADVAVVLVLRLTDDERNRAMDRIDGWSIGAHATVDRIGAHTMVLRTPAAPAVRLSRDAIAPWAAESLSDDAAPRLTPAEERRLRPLAAAGDPQARQRLTSAYAELATALALWLRPEWESTDDVLRRAHRELDAALMHDDGRPLLVGLVDRLAG